jgi:hypothetical protein
MDRRTENKASGADPLMEALGAIHRTKDASRKAASSRNVLMGKARREEELAQAKQELSAAAAKVARLTGSCTKSW